MGARCVLILTVIWHLDCVQFAEIIESEFNNRSDGFQPWLEAYGDDVLPDQIQALGTGVI